MSSALLSRPANTVIGGLITPSRWSLVRQDDPQGVAPSRRTVDLAAARVQTLTPLPDEHCGAGRQIPAPGPGIALGRASPRLRPTRPTDEGTTGAEAWRASGPRSFERDDLPKRPKIRGQRGLG